MTLVNLKVNLLMKTARRSLIYQGSCLTLYEVVVDDQHLLQEFIDELSESDQQKIAALLSYSADNGPPRNREKFKQLEKDLFEFKSYQIRIFCAFRGKSMLVLTHGIKKKKDKHDKKDMQRAHDILNLLDKNEGN